jgi:type I restriction enzyme M protein
MITVDNLKKVLEELHYTKKKPKEIYEKKYDEYDCVIKVDFDNKQITYPEDKGMKIHRKTTCNFSENENFVVLECITSLLDKGYKPSNIELEKPMPGGHDDTGGFCDIQVKDNDERTFLLIECKKADEFEKFWKRTLADGDQLFRYYNSYRQAKALCMYTSDYNDSLKRYTNIISMTDNEEYLQTNASLKSFKQVQLDNGDKVDYFSVWKDTYQLDFATNGIFEDEIEPYTIGKAKYCVDDLREVDNESMQKKYHEFATILRQHNVGSHENAFDKLVNLFLAKIVDETLNSNELQFYWKGAAYDDYYSLQDRLQKLYKEGMEKFLGEEVTYIDQKQVSEAFHLFKNDPDATRNKILDYFRQLKFYTNSDFAFLDVHNEELFYQNATILKKIVKMLEDIKLKTEEQNQFLGDLFEGFLDDGVKQSEGQFFTPLPIVKFIVSSLPLETLIRDTYEIPKAIDYACGAGHFLTEYASCIKKYVKQYKNISPNEYFKETYGVEKEYRLSKVSKVSAFMYGQDDIQIIYGDALASNKKVSDNTYSVLIANPPYSVKGFLETIDEADRKKFSLYSKVSDVQKNNSIETFFVERAKQLLKENGIAAIILPSSILSNNNIYEYCREIILKFFDIIAIAEFGSGTFGKTGTNTVTLFLRRKKTNPELAEHCRNRVNSWFNADRTKDIVFQDEDIVDEYCEKCKIDVQEYKDWLKGGKIPSAEIFTKYIDNIRNSTGYKSIEKRKVTKKFTDEDKDESLEQFIINKIAGFEKEKIYYFMLAKSNEQNVLIIKCPTDTKQSKVFLGYEWSGAKGNEGIKYIGTVVEDEDDYISKNRGINNIDTPLFDPNSYDNPDKLNTLIRKNYEVGIDTIPDGLKDYVKLYKLEDMIDFTGLQFDKAFRTTIVPVEKINSKYKTVKLNKLAKVKGGKRIPKGLTYADGVTNHPYIKVADFSGLSVDKTNLQYISDDVFAKIKNYTISKSDIYISIAGTIGVVGRIPDEIDGANLTENAAKICEIDSDQVDTDYLLYVLTSEPIKQQIDAATHQLGTPKLAITRIQMLDIPLPPLNVQKDIVTEIKKIIFEVEKSRKVIAQSDNKMSSIFEKISGKKYKISALAPYTTKRVAYDKITPEYYVSTDNMLQNCEGITKYEGTPNVDSVIEYKVNDILLSNIRPYLKKLWLSDCDGGCSPDVLVFRVDDTKTVLPKYLYYCMKQNRFFDWIMSDVKGMKMPRGKKDTIASFEVEIPSIEEQKKIVKEVESIEIVRTKNKVVVERLQDKIAEIFKRTVF